MAKENVTKPVTVKDFFDAANGNFDYQIEAGEAYTDNVILEGSLNRPGLALAGFTQYFAHRRVQVLGLAELTYLKSLSKKERRERLETFYASSIPCVVVTRNRHPLPEMVELSDAYKVPLVRTPLVTMRFVNEGTLILEDLLSPHMNCHGTMVDILGIGVLIEGEPGIGKSETALALIERGHSLVADDVTVLRRSSSGAIMASPMKMTRYHMEIRGLGIIHVPSLFGVASMRDSKRLDVIVRLIRPDPAYELDRTGLNPAKRNVLDEEIPLITLPVGPGRDIAHIVEVAALNEKLKHLGHDAAKELDEKLVRLLSRKSSE